MTSLNFLDANVSLALIWERHEHSATARQWFQQQDDQQFLYCRFTQVTVLRLITTERIMGEDTLTMSEAWRTWDRLVIDSRMAFIAEPHNLEMTFRQLSRLETQSPKVWADAYLLAFAAVAGLRLVTFDRALASRAAEVLLL